MSAEERNELRKYHGQQLIESEVGLLPKATWKKSFFGKIDCSNIEWPTIHGKHINSWDKLLQEMKICKWITECHDQNNGAISQAAQHDEDIDHTDLVRYKLGLRSYFETTKANLYECMYEWKYQTLCDPNNDHPLERLLKEQEMEWKEIIGEEEEEERKRRRKCFTEKVFETYFCCRSSAKRTDKCKGKRSEGETMKDFDHMSFSFIVII
ncbi:hypothetical protein RFI_23284, partial [Reticulomyxa filosa]